MQNILLKNWTISYDGKTFPATVPGDITIDLFKAGVIEDPYFGMNYKSSEWIQKTDFTYSTQFDAKDFLSEEVVKLTFKGIDTYSDIYLNDQKLGSTDNMFLKYTYNVKPMLKEKGNILKVEMHSTLNTMDKFDADGYYAVFNVKRLFVRKAQCHFGWDWAPRICAYGIWNDVCLEAGNKCGIDDVYVIADDKGNATFHVELNYNIHPTKYSDGEKVTGSYLDENNDILHYYISDKPNGELNLKKTIKVIGKKNFGCFKLQNPELWWPIGYGDHPLYNYKIEVERGGKITNSITGKFAFRSVELVQEPKGDSFLGFCLKVNGKEIFCRGGNWVPNEIFTGTITDQKYDKMTDLVVNGNFNILRVWGGGIYEKDIFYNLCDEKGIMVWQDIMLACADLPEDHPDWVENMVEEMNYQIKRLRSHPSIVYWCGGNEKTGCYALCIKKGDYFTEVITQGTILNLDKTRPFSCQSPWSWTDIGQDITSGESHHGSFERCLTEGMDDYRKLVAEKIVPFVSEAALMGPNSIETNKKIYPSDKLWPMNEYWDDRLMLNPYGNPMTFAKRQLYYASSMYGSPKTLEEFTAKGMMIHAEAMRVECEFARSNKGMTSGFLNWMVDDIWPSGSWSIIDYWCEPKMVYYQMKRSYSPLLVTFVLSHENKTQLVIVNDSLVPYTDNISYSVKKFDGTVLYTKSVNVQDLVNDKIKFDVDFDVNRYDVYLSVDYTENGIKKNNLYSPYMWKNVEFTSNYTAIKEQIDGNHALVKITANEFAKSVFLSMKDNFKYIYSDNYLDIEKGQTKEVYISSDENFDVNDLTICDYVKAIK